VSYSTELIIQDRHPYHSYDANILPTPPFLMIDTAAALSPHCPQHKPHPFHSTTTVDSILVEFRRSIEVQCAKRRSRIR
jgi:hypothetical protein